MDVQPQLQEAQLQNAQHERPPLQQAQLKQLKPGLHTLWRGTGAVQIGLSARRGTLIDGLTPSDSRLIDQLRTGAQARTARQRRLIDLLDEAGVLLSGSVRPEPPSGQPGQPGPPGLPDPQSRAAPPPPPDGAADVDRAERLEPDAALWAVVHPDAGDGWPLLAARADRRVLISGAGRLGGALATTLAAAGVGQVCLLDPGRVGPADVSPPATQARDLGRVRQNAAADAVVRAGGHASVADSLAGQQADAAVLVGYAAADAAAADVLLAADIPHLSIVIGEDDVVVGPLVRPGLGACLRCLDLHRSDRDPAWPSMLAQLLGQHQQGQQHRQRPGAGHPREETATSVLAAGLAALQVLTLLDGRSEPSTVGATLEIELPDGLIARRIWPPHPACGCHWPPRDRGPHPRDDNQAAAPPAARAPGPGQPSGPTGPDGRRMTT